MSYRATSVMVMRGLLTFDVYLLKRLVKNFNAYGDDEFINPHTGKPESFSERTGRIQKEQQNKERAAWDEERKKYPVTMTQKEQRALKSKMKEEQAKLAGHTQADILNRCLADGGCYVTAETLKTAFPSMVTFIGGNNYRLNINNKEFEAFLLVKGLKFVKPDNIFIKSV
jgi:hypothetical protein